MNGIEAERLQTVKEYYFSKKLREVRGLIQEGHPVINMAIGSPDLPPPPEVVTTLTQAMTDPGAHAYQSYQGIPELRNAIADFYQKSYGVSPDSTSEILPLMGSKEGIMHISMAFLNAGDRVLIPNPGYPTYTSVTRLVGAEPIYYNLDENENWLPNLDALKEQDLSGVKLMWINYPHMPTGASVRPDDLQQIADFARTYNIILVNDNPYSFILNKTPVSLLQVEGTKNHLLELNSLSKSFNMAGWRVGMAVGHSELITAILKVKSNMDSGMFYGIQKGAVQALQLSSSWFGKLNEVYQKRREHIWKIADLLQCTYDRKATGMFVWAKLPHGIEAESFIDSILYEQHIFITPGTIFGSQGKGYIRFSLCVPVKKIQEACERLRQRIENHGQ